jgi:hypothetical protein
MVLEVFPKYQTEFKENRPRMFSHYGYLRQVLSKYFGTINSERCFRGINKNKIKDKSLLRSNKIKIQILSKS